METIILIAVVLFIGFIAYKMISKKREKEISITVMTTDPVKAKEVAAAKLFEAIPADFIRSKVHAGGSTEFQFTVKKTCRKE